MAKPMCCPSFFKYKVAVVGLAQCIGPEHQVPHPKHAQLEGQHLAQQKPKNLAPKQFRKPTLRRAQKFSSVGRTCLFLDLVICCVFPFCDARPCPWFCDLVQTYISAISLMPSPSAITLYLYAFVPMYLSWVDAPSSVGPT